MTLLPLPCILESPSGVTLLSWMFPTATTLAMSTEKHKGGNIMHLCIACPKPYAGMKPFCPRCAKGFPGVSWWMQ